MRRKIDIFRFAYRAVALRSWRSGCCSPSTFNRALAPICSISSTTRCRFAIPKSFQLQLSGLIDFEGYFIDQRAPALIETDDSFLFNPRLSIFLDAQWTKHCIFCPSPCRSWF